MADYRERKALRTKLYAEAAGLKTRPCTACNGSGRYDHNGSPKCGACNGSGKEKYRPFTGAAP